MFAVIAGVLAIWWLRAPAAPNTREATLDGAPLSAPAGTPALLAQLVPEDVLPTPTRAPTATPQPTPTPTIAPTNTLPPTPATAIAPVRHKVAKGDTVSGIATKYKSTIKDIIEANNLPADGRLSVGQELIIPLAGPSGGPGPTSAPAATPTQNLGVIYTVSSGDTLSSIAQRFGSKVEWILTANNMKPGDMLAIGRVLQVPGSAATPTPLPAATVEVAPLTPTATPDPGLAAPALLAPAQGAVLSGDNAVLLSWTSVAVLSPDEWYVVTVRANESNKVVQSYWTRSTTWRLPNEYRGGGNAGMDYSWRVQVRLGTEEKPGPAVSPQSIERRFTWR